jgi:trimeric autotransporter adhesin
VQFNGQVNVLASSGTALYAAGGFTADGGTSVQLAKVDPTTAALDATFTANAGFYPSVDAIAVSGTSIFIGLQFPSAYAYLAKLDAATGVADGVFTQGSSLDSGVTALTVFGTSVYAGGYFTHYLGNSARHFLKADATTGALDMTFTQATGANANAWLASIAGQGNNIYAVGSISTYRGQPANAVTKITVATDAIDSTFAQSTGATNGNTSGAVTALALVGSSLYVAGLFSTFDGQALGNLVKVDPSSGAPDPAFTVGSLGGISSLATSGTSLYVGVGTGGCEGAAGLGCIAKLDPTTGAADPIFAPAATTDGPVDALFFSGTSLYAGGAFQTDNGLPAHNVAKLDATTAVLDQTFTGATGLVASTNGFPTVGAFALSGSALYVGGAFTSYRSTAVSDLMKIDASSGVLDTTFTETGGASNWVSSLAASNGSLYVGGYLDSYRGVSIQNLAKVDAASGVLDTIFTQAQGACHGTNGTGVCGGSVWSLTTVGTKLYLGGDVTSYRGSPAYFFFPVDATSGALLDP